MRSKTLMTANILATLWGGGMLLYFGSFLMSGGWETLSLIGMLVDLLGELSGTTDVLIIVNVILTIMMLHAALIVLGAMFGWIGFAARKSGFAKAAAVFYLVATLVCPLYLLAGLPITIIGFVGSGRQKKLVVANA